MAFFSDGSTTYFSLNLDPTGPNPCYVFRLSPPQEAVAKHFVKPAFVVAVLTFLLTFALVTIKAIGLRDGIVSDDAQILVVMGLASIAAVSAMSEVIFFLWIRSTGKSLLSPTERRSGLSLETLRERSRLGYAIFLLDMTVPFVLLLALPGDTGAIVREIGSYGVGNTIFFLCLLCTATIIGVQLVRKIVVLSK